MRGRRKRPVSPRRRQRQQPSTTPATAPAKPIQQPKEFLALAALAKKSKSIHAMVKMTTSIEGSDDEPMKRKMEGEIWTTGSAGKSILTGSVNDERKKAISVTHGKLRFVITTEDDAKEAAMGMCFEHEKRAPMSSSESILMDAVNGYVLFAKSAVFESHKPDEKLASKHPGLKWFQLKPSGVDDEWMGQFGGDGHFRLGISLTDGIVRVIETKMVYDGPGGQTQIEGHILVVLDKIELNKVKKDDLKLPAETAGFMWKVLGARGDRKIETPKELVGKEKLGKTIEPYSFDRSRPTQPSEKAPEGEDF